MTPWGCLATVSLGYIDTGLHEAVCSISWQMPCPLWRGVFCAGHQQSYAQKMGISRQHSSSKSRWIISKFVTISQALGKACELPSTDNAAAGLSTVLSCIRRAPRLRQQGCRPFGHVNSFTKGDFLTRNQSAPPDGRRWPNSDQPQAAGSTMGSGCSPELASTGD